MKFNKWAIYNAEMGFSHESVEVFEVDFSQSELRIYATVFSQKEQTDVNFVRSKLSSLSMLPISPENVKVGDLILILTATGDLEHCICRALITDLDNINKGFVKVLLVDEGQWNVPVPLDELYFCPPPLHISIVPPLYEMFLLADIPPQFSWNPQLIHNLKSKLQRKQIPAIVKRDVKKNYICPLDKDSGQSLIMEILTADTDTRLSPILPEITPNFANLPQLPLGTIMPFSPYSNLCQMSQFPFPSFGPNSNFYIPPISAKGVNIPAPYSPQIPEGYPIELKKSEPNFQADSNSVQLPMNKKNCYSTERLSAGKVMKGKISYIVKGPWKFYIQFDDQRKQYMELKEQLNDNVNNLKQYQGKIKQAFQLVVRVLGEFHRALAIEDESLGRIKVLFVDTGHIEYLDTSEVFLLPESLNKYSFLVTRCKLSGLSKNFDERISAKFYKLTLNSELIVEICEPLNGAHQDHLVEVNISIKGHSVLERLIGYRNEVLLNGGKVHISHICEEDEIMYVQDSRKADQLKSMQIVLQDNAKTAEFQDLESLNVHEACLAMLPSNKNWYRAKILRTGVVTKVQGRLQENIMVFFVDYGKCAWVSYNQIRQIEPALQELMPAQAIPTIIKDMNLTNITSNEALKLLKARVWEVKIVASLQKKLQNSSLMTIAEVEISDAESGKNITQVVDIRLSPQQMDEPRANILSWRKNDSEPPQIYADSLKLCRIINAQSPKCFYVTLVENCPIAKQRETTNEHSSRSHPARTIKCALALEEATLENLRFREAFRNQALGQILYVHFKEKEHDIWKVEFVEKMDAPKVMAVMKETAKAKTSSTDNANLEDSLVTSTTAAVSVKNPQFLFASKDTTETDKKPFSNDAGISSTSPIVKKPSPIKQHWKDLIINNLPAEVIAKHKKDIDSANKKISDASLDVCSATKVSTLPTAEHPVDQVDSYSNRISPSIVRDVPTDIKMNKEKIENYSIPNARNDKGNVGSVLRPQNTFSLGSMIKKKIEQDAAFRGSNGKINTDISDQIFKLENCKQIAPAPSNINQCNMQYLHQNIEINKITALVVTCVESPIKYYCQLKDINTEIFDIRMREAQLEYDRLRAMENNKTNINSFKKYPLRSSVMAYNDMKHRWYRGTILEYVSSSEVKVQFVDHGNVEIIPLSDIFAMNEKFIAGIPQQAISIVVDGIDQEFLKQFDVQLLRTKLENKTVKCVFDKKLSSCEYHATSLIIPGEDLKEYLMSTGIKLPAGLKETRECSEKDGSYERYTHTNFSSASVLAKKSGKESSIDGMIIRKDELPKGRPVQVYVSYVDKDKSFWVQQLDGVHKLSDMMEKLQMKMSDSEFKSKISSPTVNSYCTCKFSEDDTWYRGKIMEISESLNVKVHYIDYGNNELLEISDIYELPHEFTKLPEQAIHCCLPEFPNYNKEKMMILNSLIKENELISILSYEVFDDMNILYQVSNKEVSEIPKSLVNSPLNPNFFSSDVVDGNNPNTFNKAIATGISEAMIENLEKNEVVKTPNERVSFKDLRTAPLVTGGMTKPAPLTSKSVVFITHSESSVGRVWLQRAEDTELLATVEGNIETSITSMQVVDVPDVGLICLGKSCEDGIWYRARVKELFAESVLVHYLDYGNTEKINKSQCYTIPKELEHQPALAYSCILNVDKKQYVDAMKILQEYLDMELIVNVHGEHNDCYNISLMSGQENILKNLHAISDKENTQLHTKDTDIVSKPLSLDSTHPQKKLSCKMDQINPFTISSCLVTISYVEENGAIWIQRNDSIDALATLMDSLYEYMSTTTPVILKDPEVGEACVCQYSVDESWYRGRVLNVNPTAITVLYSDYGNVEILDPSKVYSLPSSFLSLPEQAVRCNVPDFCKELSKSWLENECIASVSVHDNQPFLSFLKLGELQYIPQETTQSVKSDMSVQESKLSETQSSLNLVDESTWNKTTLTNLDVTKVEDSTWNKTSMTNLEVTQMEESTWNKTSLTNLEVSQVKDDVKNCRQLPKQDPIAINLTDVIFSHYESGGLLWLRPMDSDSALTTLMDAIHAYTQTATLSSINNINEGLACLCCYSEDNEWYRVRVLKVTSDPQEISILYVDYGNTQTVDSSKLFSLPMDFYSLPEQAIKCKIPEYYNEFAKDWLDQMGKVSVFLYESVLHLSFLQVEEQVYIPKSSDESKNVDESDSVYQSKHSESSAMKEDVATKNVVAKNSSNISKEEFLIEHLNENNFNAFKKTNTSDNMAVENGLVEQSVGQDLSLQDASEPLVTESNHGITATTLNTDKQVNEAKYIESIDTMKNNGNVNSTTDIFNDSDQMCNTNLERKENSVSKDDSENKENTASVLSDSSLSPTISVNSTGDESFNSKSNKSVIFNTNHNNSILEYAAASEKIGDISEPSTLSDSISNGTCPNETNPFKLNDYSTEIPDCVVDESLWNKTVSLSVNTCAVKETDNCLSASLLSFDGNIVWIQLNEYSRLFDAFMDDLHIHMEESIKSTISKPSIGDACICRYTLDSGWYRARVMEVHGNDSAFVFYVDYGNSETQKICNIYNLPHKFEGFPQQAIKCKLPNGFNEPLSNFMNKKLKMKLIKVKDDFVIQYIESDNKEYILSKPSVAPFSADNLSCHLSPNTGELLKLEDPSLLNKSNMIISHLEGNQSVWLQNTSSSESLDILMNDLDNYMKESTPLVLEKPYIGQACVCQYSEDEGWYRARVFKISHDYTKITVLFVDYGNMENKEQYQIFKLPVKFTMLSEQSINCFFPDTFTSANESLINKECIVSVLETDGIPIISYFKLDGIEYITEHQLLAAKENILPSNKEQIVELPSTMEHNKERFSETTNNSTSNNVHTEKNLDKSKEQTQIDKSNISLPVEFSSDDAKELVKPTLIMGSEVLSNSALINRTSEGQQRASEDLVKSSELTHVNDGKNLNNVLHEECANKGMTETKKEKETSTSEIGKLEEKNMYNQDFDVSSIDIQESVKNTLQNDISITDGADQILDGKLDLNSSTSKFLLGKDKNISESIEPNNEQVDSFSVEKFSSEPEILCGSNKFCSAEPKMFTMESPITEHDFDGEKMYSSTMKEGIPNIIGNEDGKNVNTVKQFQAFCALLVHIEETPFCLWIQEEDNLDTVDFVDSSLEQIKTKEYVDNPEVDNVYGATLSTAPLRVLVRQVEKGEAFVHFIDQGKKSWISTSRIFRIPAFLSEIEPLAKACYLPVTIIPGRHSGAVLAMAETVLKKMCVCVSIKDYNGECGPGNLMLMSSPLIGCLYSFLADHNLAQKDDWKAHVGPEAANIIESNLNTAMLKVTKIGVPEQNSSLLDNTLFVTADEGLAQKLKELSFV